MRFIFSYVKKHIWLVAFAITLKTAAAMGELMLPYILEHLIDDVVPKADMTKVILWGIGMVLLAVLVRQLNVKANRGAVKVARESIYAIRKDLFWKSLDLSGNQVDEFGLPSLTSRMTSDSYNLQNFIQSIQAMGVRAPIMLVGGITITMTMDPGLAAILCIMVPILITIVVFVSFKGIPLYEKVQRSVDDIVRIMRENITGIRVVKSLSKEPYEKARFESSNKEMVTNDMKAGTVMAMPGPIMTLFLNMTSSFKSASIAGRDSEPLSEVTMISPFSSLTRATPSGSSFSGAWEFVLMVMTDFIWDVRSAGTPSLTRSPFFRIPTLSQYLSASSI